MSWDISQTRRFSRSYKKLHDNLVAEVDQAVSEVADNPDIGEKKNGDLTELWVHKFHALGQLYLLGYAREDGIRLIYLEALGSHENFYRDLKR